MQSKSVLDFWFQELTPADWWRKSEELDNTIAKRFGDFHQAAVNGELADWRQSADAETAAKGRLAEVIVLDQFSRNIYRDQPQAFAWDGMALVLAQEAISLGLDQALPIEQRSFLISFMHSESAMIRELPKLFRKRAWKAITSLS